MLSLANISTAFTVTLQKLLPVTFGDPLPEGDFFSRLGRMSGPQAGQAKSVRYLASLGTALEQMLMPSSEVKMTLNDAPPHPPELPRRPELQLRTW